MAGAMVKGRSIRMFVAVDIPEEVSLRIIGILDGVGEHGARVVGKNGMHATLAFFGSMNERQQDLLCGILSNAVFRQFEVVLSGFGLLGRGIVYAKITEGASELGAISSMLKSASRDAGIDVDMRDFFPHVTVARVRNGGGESVRKFLDGIGESGPLRFTCTRISAKRSDFTDMGVEHTEVCSKDLI